MSNEWHFVSFEFEPLLFQLDEFCSTTLLFYYDWNLCSGRKLCSSCLRSNYSTSLRLSMAEKGKPEWMSMASVPIHVISWKTWPRNGTVEVKICRGVWGLELMRYCCYLVGTSYFSLSYFSPFLSKVSLNSAQTQFKRCFMSCWELPTPSNDVTPNFSCCSPRSHASIENRHLSWASRT